MVLLAVVGSGGGVHKVVVGVETPTLGHLSSNVQLTTARQYLALALSFNLFYRDVQEISIRR